MHISRRKFTMGFGAGLLSSGQIALASTAFPGSVPANEYTVKANSLNSSNVSIFGSDRWKNFARSVSDLIDADSKKQPTFRTEQDNAVLTLIVGMPNGDSTVNPSDAFVLHGVVAALTQARGYKLKTIHIVTSSATDNNATGLRRAANRSQPEQSETSVVWHSIDETNRDDRSALGAVLNQSDIIWSLPQNQTRQGDYVATRTIMSRWFTLADTGEEEGRYVERIGEKWDMTVSCRGQHLIRKGSDLVSVMFSPSLLLMSRNSDLHDTRSFGGLI